MQYHIVPGRYLTENLFNNTIVFTAMGVPVTPFNDPCMTEGAMMIHDNCVDKTTPDNFTCYEQQQVGQRDKVKIQATFQRQPELN